GARQLRVFFACLAFAIVGILIVVPRPTFPESLPLPSIDPKQMELREQSEIKRAMRVANGSLSVQVRAIGEQVRRVGLQAAQSRPVPAPQLKTLEADVNALLTNNQIEALLDLRALQAEI